MKAKPGELKFGWSNDDIVYAWGGDGASREDAHLLDLFLNKKLFDKTLQEELISRGYDITTIKFSIRVKK